MAIRSLMLVLILSVFAAPAVANGAMALAAQTDDAVLLYEADWTDGETDGWAIGEHWWIEESMLIGIGSTDAESAIAPYQNETRVFAIETEFYVHDPSWRDTKGCQKFGLWVQVAEGVGYHGDVLWDCLQPAPNGDDIDVVLAGVGGPRDGVITRYPVEFDEYHTFRLEVRSTSVRFIVDGTHTVEIPTDQLPADFNGINPGATIRFDVEKAAVAVLSFKVFALEESMSGAASSPTSNSSTPTGESACDAIAIYNDQVLELLALLDGIHAAFMQQDTDNTLTTAFVQEMANAYDLLADGLEEIKPPAPAEELHASRIATWRAFASWYRTYAYEVANDIEPYFEDDPAIYAALVTSGEDYQALYELCPEDLPAPETKTIG